jgi:hypothetical protein
MTYGDSIEYAKTQTTDNAFVIKIDETIAMAQS